MKKGHQGASLIEVLISLLILSIVLLSFDSMQLFALRESRHNYLMNLANDQLQSMAERLRAHPNVNELQNQLAIWNKENTQLLPFGKGTISGSYPSYQITLFWGQKTQLRTCKQIKIGDLNCLSIKIQL